MVNVALLGFGTVGSGVAEVLTRNGDLVDSRVDDLVRLKYIKRAREVFDGPYQDLFVKDFSIIEQDPQRCVALSTMLPKAIIIEADGSRQDVLAEEGIEKTDAVVTLTDIDEENLIISLFAVQKGVPKVIAKINRSEYIDTFQNLGVDTFINPKQLSCSDIVRLSLIHISEPTRP